MLASELFSALIDDARGNLPVLVACGGAHSRLERVEVGMAPNSGVGGICLLLEAWIPDAAEQLEEANEELEDCHRQNDELRCALEEILDADKALRRAQEVADVEGHADLSSLKAALRESLEKAAAVL